MQQTAQFSKSKVPCLLRHRGGNYYASAKVSGKVIRRSIETEDYNVAKNRLPAVLAEMRGAKNSIAERLAHLISGIPGTGKSLTAKAIATAFVMP